MTRPELERLVARGEGSHLEFKKRTPEPERIVREMVAFANSGGGNILIGVDDDGTILGVKDTPEEEFAVRRAVDDWVIPRLSWSLELVPVSRKREVLVVLLSAGLDGPFLVRKALGSEAGIMYVRYLDESLVASPEAFLIARRESDKTGGSFEFGPDELLVMGLLETSGRVTVKDLSKRAHLSIFKAREVLVSLTLGGVLNHVVSRPDDYFIAGDETL
jgi:predicted HTH transcriptional regulator